MPMPTEVRPATYATERLAANHFIPMPAIGRVVHYVSRGSADGAFAQECRAAVVTAASEGIWCDENKGTAVPVVSLCVLNPNGHYFNLMVPYDEAHGPGTWHWPELEARTFDTRLESHREPRKQEVRWGDEDQTFAGGAETNGFSADGAGDPPGDDHPGTHVLPAAEPHDAAA